MATTNIGQVSIVPMGAFNLGTAYKRLSVVTYNGSSYIAKQDNQNIAITNTAYWYLLASKGDKGDTYEVTPEDLQAIADQITSDASSAFNVHVTEKTTEFDNHVTSKTGDFDTNASNKTTTFNNNATDKTTAFNNNASSKTTDFNTNASDKTTAFNTNAQAKVDYYNQNADELIAFNEELLDQIPTANVEGTTINVNDSSNLPLADIQIKGNASQTTTSIAGGDEYDSPTPDHPQPISVVTGDNTVTIVGENRLPNFTNETKSGVTITSNSPELTFNGTNTGDVNGSSNWFTLPVGTYYINAKYVSGSLTDVTQIIFRKRGVTTNLANISFNTTNYMDDKTARFTLTQTTDIRAYVYCGSAERTFNNFKINIQVTQSNSPNYNFTPYQGSSQLISLGDIELAKIGDYQDYIYKSEGKWYKYGAIQKKILDGTETWQINTNTSYAYNLFYDEVSFTDYLKTSGAIALCTRFKGGDNSSNSGGVYPQGDSIVCFRNNPNDTLKTLYITNNSSSIDDFKTLLTNNNATLYYVLATPTITEITDTTLVGQLDNLLAMKTNRNITNMFTITDNETPTLAVLYRQDLTTLFNNLTSAILSLGNNT